MPDTTATGETRLVTLSNGKQFKVTPQRSGGHIVIPLPDPDIWLAAELYDEGIELEP